MKVLHYCSMDIPDMPGPVSVWIRRWRCPVCGQYWKQIIRGGGSSEAQRLPIPNFRLWRWNRNTKKKLR